jgi:valyl-tRNA synthetase
LASGYLEKTKDREDKKTVFSILVESYLTSLKLLHPFMPFVTETIWGELKDLRDNPEELLITATWPTIKTHQK